MGRLCCRDRERLRPEGDLGCPWTFFFFDPFALLGREEADDPE